ncbi:unnamed protein product [Closterium sp. NIES-54]
MASWQLSVLALCTLTSLLAPAAARPTKEDFIDELKKTRDALADSKLNNRYHATHTLLDHVIPQLETDWNPNEDFLNKVDHKTFMLPEDTAIATKAPDALAMMVKSGMRRGEVDPFTKLFRAQMLDGVYDSEDDLAKASDTAKIRYAVSLLRGPAMDWWHVIVTKPTDYATLPTWEGQTGPWAPSYFVEVPQYRTWDAWCAGLRARFEPIAASIAALQKLRTWRQLGSVQDYTSGFLALCEQVGYIHEYERIDRYIGGPKHDIAQEIQLRCVTDFQEILAMAEKLDFFPRARPGSAQTLYDAVVARYSSPATAALSRLFLPYLFPDLAAFPTVADLITHLRTSDARYRTALPAEFCAKNPPPLYLTLYYVTAALGASASAAPGAGESAPSGTASAQVLHTFTLDSGASRSFFQDRTTLTPLSRPVAVSLADPSGGPVLARDSTVLPCPAAPSGSLSGLYLPSFSTNLVSGADLQDQGVDQFTPATASSQVLAAASGSGPESAPCSCRLLSHQTLLWHHRLGHPSLPRLRGMASRVLVSEAPLQTLHMDVWGPARVRGQGHERYFLLVVDDCSRYTTVFPLRSKGEVTEVLIDWIHAARLRLRESFGSDFPVLRLHSDRGGEFSSALLGAFCRAQGIRHTFTLPASPQQNGIAERRIGMVMDVARTSMIHAAAPHFLWPFAVQYAAHHLNLQPRVSLPETSPTLLWTGKVGDASAFRVWGSRAFVRDLSADKLSPRAVLYVFLGFPPDAPGWQFYHPTSRRVLSSQDVTFDESVPYYRLFPYRTASLPPPPLFLAPGPPPVDPLPPQGPAPSGVSQVDAVEPVEVAVDSGAATGAEPVGAGSGSAWSGGAETEGAEPGDWGY